MFNHIIRRQSYLTAISKLSKLTKSCQPIRHYAGTDSAAYGGDGKTTVKILNQEEKTINLVNTYSDKGFRLSNDLFIAGSILLFPTHVYSWNVRRGIDITPESLIVFDLIVPRIKILLIGYGERDEPFDGGLAMKLKKKGISCEILPTQNAVTTYNYLVADCVHAAGAFVPVRDQVLPTKRDMRALNEWDIMFSDKDSYGHDVPEPEPKELEDTYREASGKGSKKDKFDK